MQYISKLSPLLEVDEMLRLPKYLVLIAIFDEDYPRHIHTWRGRRGKRRGGGGKRRGGGGKRRGGGGRGGEEGGRGGEEGGRGGEEGEEEGRRGKRREEGEEEGRRGAGSDTTSQRLHGTNLGMVRMEG